MLTESKRESALSLTQFVVSSADGSKEESYKAIADQVLKSMEGRSKSSSGASVEIKPLFMTHDGASVGSIQDHFARILHSDRAAGQITLGQVYGEPEKTVSIASLSTTSSLRYRYRPQR